MSNEKKVNWMDIEQIRHDVETTRNYRNGIFPEGLDDGGKERLRQTSEWFFSEIGNEMTLKVKVIDPELAQAVLQRSFGSYDISLIPGMEITEIGLNGSVHEEEVLLGFFKLWLEATSSGQLRLDKFKEALMNGSLS